MSKRWVPKAAPPIRCEQPTTTHSAVDVMVDTLMHELSRSANAFRHRFETYLERYPELADALIAHAPYWSMNITEEQREAVTAQAEGQLIAANRSVYFCTTSHNPAYTRAWFAEDTGRAVRRHLDDHCDEDDDDCF